MKRKVPIAVSGILGIAIIAILLVYFVVGLSVRSNIKHCQELYPGSPEDALIAYMKDEKRHPEDRTHVAIWTLGQICSEKALPYIYDQYKDDPKGKTCADKHDTELCQYEIHKAITSIEKGRLLAYERFME